jgi:DNA-binding CsgD family transcriptional regulator
MLQSPRSRPRVLVALLAALALPIAGCGEDDEIDVAVGEVELLEAGDGEMFELPGPYERGQFANNVFTIDQQVEGAGLDIDVNVELQADSRVANVAGGEATVEQTIGSFTVDTGETPATSPELDALQDLEGAVLTTVYDEQGRQVGEIEFDGRGPLPPGFEEFQSGGADLFFPDEPVGAGARWVAGVESAAEAGPPITAEVTYELTEISDDGYTLEISGDTPFDEEVDGVEFSGDITQDGQVQGDPSNPLVVDMTYEVRLEAEADGESFSTTVSADATSTEGTEAGGLGALTPTEQDVFELATSGAPDIEIANALGLAPPTVEEHLQGIYEKLEVESRSELVNEYGG